MRRPVAAPVLVVAGCVLALAACGGSEPAPVDALTVSGAWARPTPAGAANGVVYFSIASPDDDAITGVGVPAEIADAASLHESTTGGDGGSHAGHGGGGDGAEMAGMEEQGRIELPADEVVTLEPGGLHVMLTDLADRLEVGERFELTIDLEQGGTLTTEVVVADNAP